MEPWNEDAYDSLRGLVLKQHPRNIGAAAVLRERATEWRNAVHRIPMPRSGPGRSMPPSGSNIWQQVLMDALDAAWEKRETHHVAVFLDLCKLWGDFVADAYDEEIVGARLAGGGE